MSGRRGFVNVFEAFLIPVVVAMFGLGASYLIQTKTIKADINVEKEFVKEIRSMVMLGSMQVSYSRTEFPSDELQESVDSIFYNYTEARKVDYYQRMVDNLEFFIRVCKLYDYMVTTDFCRSFMNYLTKVGGAG